MVTQTQNLVPITPGSATAAEELFARLPPARVIVELAPDGTYTIESYRNGSRTRENIGTDTWLIRDTLQSLAASIRAEAERRLRQLQDEAAARSRRVYFAVAADHGKYFADKYVGQPAGLRQPRDISQAKTTKAKSAAQTTAPQTDAPAKAQSVADLSAVFDLF